MKRRSLKNLTVLEIASHKLALRLARAEKNKDKLKQQKKDWQTRNKEKVVAQKREWVVNNPEIIRQSRKEWQLANPEKLKAIRAKMKKRRAETQPEKVRAWKLFEHAIARGRIVRQPCRVCGDVKSHGHHADYSRPYDVDWLCAAHHREEHRRLLKEKTDPLGLFD